MVGFKRGETDLAAGDVDQRQVVLVEGDGVDQRTSPPKLPPLCRAIVQQHAARLHFQRLELAIDQDHRRLIGRADNRDTIHCAEVDHCVSRECGDVATAWPAGWIRFGH